MRRRAAAALAAAAAALSLLAVPARGADSVDALLSPLPLTLLALSFTSPNCTALLSSLQLAEYPPPRDALAAPPRLLPASAITLNAPTNKAACRVGTLTFADSSVPANATRVVNPYTLFLRVAKDILPIRFFSYSAGVLSDCPTTLAASEDTPAFSITSVFLFTPKGNATQISVAGAGVSSENVVRLLAEDVVYGAVAFVLDGAGLAEEAKTLPDLGAGAPPSADFYCFLANDVTAAEKAVKRGLAAGQGGGDAGGKGKGNSTGPPELPSARRELSPGEAVGIAGGTVIAAFTVVTAFISRRRSSYDSGTLPQGL